jgi:hypothetical protein
LAAAHSPTLTSPKTQSKLSQSTSRAFPASSADLARSTRPPLLHPLCSSTVHFPLQLNYTTDIDSNFAIISDIASKCGFLGATASDLTVNYKINLKVKVIVVTIPIS